MERPVAEPQREDEPAFTLARSRHDLEAKTKAHIDVWGLGKTERWDVNLDTGIISFSDPGLLVTARVQIVGSYDPADGTWLWGWDHPSVDPPLAEDAHRARSFGERYGLRDYVTPMIACPPERCWEFAALTSYLAGPRTADRPVRRSCS
jgi:hypothetical protein